MQTQTMVFHQAHKHHAGKDIKSHLVLPPTQGRINCHFWQIFPWLVPEDLPGRLLRKLSCQCILYPYNFQTFLCITYEFSDWSEIHYFLTLPSQRTLFNISVSTLFQLSLLETKNYSGYCFPFSRPLIVLIALLWTVSTRLTSFLKCSAQTS